MTRWILLIAEHWRLLWKIRGDFPFTSDISTVVHERAENAMPPPLTTPIVIDGFEILGVLGRGGSGVVYKAYQTRLDRVVALKMLSAGVHASPRAIARLRAESAMIARLKHPQVVTIHDVGEHQGMPYLCLEYIEGGSLADRLDHKPLPGMAAARLTAALARVVQDAHDRGIIHRDLKPANVLAAGPADGPLEPAILKLTDFGLAKRLDGDNAASSLSSGLIVGTPSYMAPELATSRAAAAAAGPAVDIYGLGAILYEMLTGRPPFLGESPMETVVQVISSPPAAPSHFNSGVPDTLEAICLKCLAKDPMQRYPSARDLAAALDHCANEPARNAANRRRVMSKRISRACKLTTIASTLLVLAGLFGYFARRRQPSIPIVSAPRRAISLMGPPSGWFSQGQNYIEHGRVDLVPPLETAYGHCPAQAGCAAASACG